MKEYELTPAQLKQYVDALDAVERYRDLSDEEKELIVKAMKSSLRCNGRTKTLSKTG